MDVSNDHRLQPADHEAIYFNHIRFDHLDHVVPSDHPRAIILGGQSGAGKSSVANAAVRELGGDMAVVRIDTDEIRSYHPSYRELAAVANAKSYTN
jgi:2-phosphoglycerate kinase